MNLQRGLVRLAISAVTVWFVFWTFAYVLDPYSSLKPEMAYADRVTSWMVMAPCVVTAVLLAVWTAAGLRSGLGPPPMRG